MPHQLDSWYGGNCLRGETGESIVIPFVDLKAQYTSIRDEVNAAIQGVLDSCQFTLGPEVAKFEEEFAVYCGSSMGIGVNTGTSALHLALLAADVGPGDEVITVPFTFVATGRHLLRRPPPLFVDVDPGTLTMADPSRRITPGQCIIPALYVNRGYGPDPGHRSQPDRRYRDGARPRR